MHLAQRVEVRRLWAVQFELLAFLDEKPDLKAAFAEPTGTRGRRWWSCSG